MYFIDCLIYLCLMNLHINRVGFFDEQQYNIKTVALPLTPLLGRVVVVVATTTQ